MSGFDWRYFPATRNPILRSWMLPAAPIGGLLPIVLPLLLQVPAEAIPGNSEEAPTYSPQERNCALAQDVIIKYLRCRIVCHTRAYMERH
jgi:hypothetical protein